MVKRSPTLGALVSTKTKCIKVIFIGKITLAPVAFLMALSILSDLPLMLLFLFRMCVTCVVGATPIRFRFIDDLFVCFVCLVLNDASILVGH